MEDAVFPPVDQASEHFGQVKRKRRAADLVVDDRKRRFLFRHGLKDGVDEIRPVHAAQPRGTADLVRVEQIGDPLNELFQPLVMVMQ